MAQQPTRVGEITGFWSFLCSVRLDTLNVEILDLDSDSDTD